MTSLLVNTCGGSLDEVANNVHNMRRNLMISNESHAGKVSISIYMNREFWVHCMTTPKGSVPSFMFDFYDSHCNPEREHQLLGYAVYVVDGDSHPDCVIYGRVIGTNGNPPVSDLKKW